MLAFIRCSASAHLQLALEMANLTDRERTAIDLCGIRGLKYSTCEHLSWLYIVRDHITGQQTDQPTPLSVDPSSEFLQAVDGKDSVAVFAIMDDLMDTIRATAPLAYDHVMRRVREIS